MMSLMENSNQTLVQAKLFDFAVMELVHRNRGSFHPLWTVDSWVKFLIWLSLNCGLSGERESLELFANSLGDPLTSRMRRMFFERTLDSLSLQILADPAESQILILPISSSLPVTLDQAEKALLKVELLEMVAFERKLWQQLDAVISIPWRLKEKDA